VELKPHTDAGCRLVEIAESHIEAFRERAAAHDREASFPSENFDDLRKSGAACTTHRSAATPKRWLGARACCERLRAPDRAAPHRMGFAFIPVGSPGVTPQNDWDALGMRASGSQSIVLDDCRVPAGSVQLVGNWGEWNAGVLMGRTLGNVTLLGAFLGIAERAAARAVLESATCDIDALLSRGDSPDLATAHGCMRDYQCAKWTVNQSAIRIVSRAMDVCGGGAFMSGHELSRLYRDVRAGPFMQPFSPSEAREYIGQIALDRPPRG
jgi:alkylation response protein AidB-like acyl-CoA dehydrogenase